MTTTAIEAVAPPTMRRSGSATRQRLYMPRRDKSGAVYYEPTTEDAVLQSIIDEDRNGNVKTYTTKEVRQNLERKLGFRL